MCTATWTGQTNNDDKQALSRWRHDRTLRTHRSVSFREGHVSQDSTGQTGSTESKHRMSQKQKSDPCGGTVVKQFGERRHFPADLPHRNRRRQREHGNLWCQLFVVGRQAAILLSLLFFFRSSFHGEMLMFVPSCASEAQGLVETICNSNVIMTPPVYHWAPLLAIPGTFLLDFSL